MSVLSDKKDIIGRLKLAYGFKTQIELADFLGVSPSALTNWNSRDSINYELIFTKCESLSFDWILTGQGPMCRKDLLKVNSSDSENLEKSTLKEEPFTYGKTEEENVYKFLYRNEVERNLLQAEEIGRLKEKLKKKK